MLHHHPVEWAPEGEAAVAPSPGIRNFNEDKWHVYQKAGDRIFPDMDTQLVQAVRKGQSARVRALLEAGADAGATTPQGYTALVYSASQGDAESVKALVEAGAPVDQGHRQADRGLTALIYSARGGHLLTAQILLEQGANVNAERSGMTALKMATAQGHTEMVRLLEEAGATR
jgi:ankyrin repeat protein